MKTWILTKILSYLEVKEGIEVLETTDKGVLVQDAFGYRYQIQITLLGRLTDTVSTFEGIEYAALATMSKSSTYYRPRMPARRRLLIPTRFIGNQRNAVWSMDHL